MKRVCVRSLQVSWGGKWCWYLSSITPTRVVAIDAYLHSHVNTCACGHEYWHDLRAYIHTLWVYVCACVHVNSIIFYPLCRVVAVHCTWRVKRDTLRWWISYWSVEQIPTWHGLYGELLCSFCNLMCSVIQRKYCLGKNFLKDINVPDDIGISDGIAVISCPEQSWRSPWCSLTQGILYDMSCFHTFPPPPSLC